MQIYVLSVTIESNNIVPAALIYYIMTSNLCNFSYIMPFHRITPGIQPCYDLVP